MRKLRAWLLRFKGLFLKDARERDFADELESHLQMHVDDNIRAGMAPHEARRVAVMKLGGVEHEPGRRPPVVGDPVGHQAGFAVSCRGHHQGDGREPVAREHETVDGLDGRARAHEQGQCQDREPGCERARGDSRYLTRRVQRPSV